MVHTAHFLLAPSHFFILPLLFLLLLLRFSLLFLFFRTFFPSSNHRPSSSPFYLQPAVIAARTVAHGEYRRVAAYLQRAIISRRSAICNPRVHAYPRFACCSPGHLLIVVDSRSTRNRLASYCIHSDIRYDEGIATGEEEGEGVGKGTGNFPI